MAAVSPCLLSSNFLDSFILPSMSTARSMSELRYRRVLEHNQQLREDLARPRIRISEASSGYISELLSRNAGN